MGTACSFKFGKSLIQDVQNYLIRIVCMQILTDLMNVHLYADDTYTQLYTSFADPDSEVHARTRMEACIAEMKTRMICNKLQLNDDNSEFLIIALRHQMSKNSMSLFAYW